VIPHKLLDISAFSTQFNTAS